MTSKDIKGCVPKVKEARGQVGDLRLTACLLPVVLYPKLPSLTAKIGKCKQGAIWLAVLSVQCRRWAFPLKVSESMHKQHKEVFPQAPQALQTLSRK